MNNDEKFHDWILNNENEAQLDIVLEELYSQAKKEKSQEDAVLASKGFAEFSKRTGMRDSKKRARFLKVMINTSAALFLPSLICLLWLFLGQSSKKDSISWIEEVTGFSERKEISLQDGTKVLLGACSRILYPSEFHGSERKVFISGEAFLDVAKDTKRKFIVSAEKNEIFVHGTRFYISSFLDSKEEEVALLEGSIEMRRKDRLSSLYLSPGEVVRYSKDSGSTTILDFDVRSYEETMNAGGIQFIDLPLSEIALRLSRIFNVKIIVESEKIAEEKYYAFFSNGENLDRILAMLNMEKHFKITTSTNLIKLTEK